jgi:hypothetical protein
MRRLPLGVIVLSCALALAALCVTFTNTGSAATANPLLMLIRNERARAAVVGRVEQRIAAGPYTYLEVRGERERVWVVTLGAGAPPGSQVRVRSFGRQLNFHSRRLQRSFPELVFGHVSAKAR